MRADDYHRRDFAWGEIDHSWESMNLAATEENRLMIRLFLLGLLRVIWKTNGER